MAQRMTFGLFSGAASQRIEFVRMKGPRGTIAAFFFYTKTPEYPYSIAKLIILVSHTSFMDT